MSEPRVRLRAVTEEDLPRWVAWINDPEVTRFTGLEAGTATLEGEQEWFKSVTSPECRTRNWQIEVGGRHIGGCSLDPDGTGQTAVFGIIIGDKTAWSRGYGQTALREVLRAGFIEMGLHRVYLEAFAENARAIRCYEKCGFRHEGLHREARFKRGEWRDTVSMAILRDEWEALIAPETGLPQPVGQELARPERSRGASCPPGLRFRSYRPSDYDAVVALWREAGFHVDDRDDERGLACKLARDPSLFLLGEAEGRVIATVIGSWDGRRGWVFRLAVAPEHQRQGIGTRLMGEVEGRLKALGARSVALMTGRSNAVAQHLYRSLGYETGDEVLVMLKRFGHQATPEECCGH